MLISFLYIIGAILGLSLLIFLHELGHYWMAKRVGMRVETFSIGFGRPIFSWMHEGTKWQIAWLPFGGYVKIAGTDLEEESNPHDIKDGFFGKTPFDRLKVAIMGPLVNILLAFFVFSLLWMMQGREKNFADYTHKIGWVDEKSELYQHGVRPGDEITGYNSNPLNSARDHLYIPMTVDKSLTVQGNKLDYTTGEKIPFDYSISVYPLSGALEKGLKTSGVIQGVNYLLYEKEGQESALLKDTPLANVDLQNGDRLLWANGEIVFSTTQLNHILDGKTALLTVQRGKETFLASVPREQMQEFRINSLYREELIDWQFEAGLNQTRLSNLYTIPYVLNDYLIVEGFLSYIEIEKNKEKDLNSNTLNRVLEKGDLIVAVDGVPITTSSELLRELQTYKALLIIQRNPSISKVTSWDKADSTFDSEVNWDLLNSLVNRLGTKEAPEQLGDLIVVGPIVPKTRLEILSSSDKGALIQKQIQEQRKLIGEISDPERKNQALKMLEKQEKQLLIGFPASDKKVNYDPNPVSQLYSVFQEISRTITALISGNLSPKYISGPVGIVQVVHDTSMSSFKEALYWLGAISLNLGILNLLPIPVLDGGTIMMSLVEMVTRKRINPKTLEKIIMPFAVLLIIFFVFLTFNDISRLFKLWK